MAMDAAKGKEQHLSFYFVLYIVAIVTVFSITSERDVLLKKRDEDLAQLIEVYVKPLRLTAVVDTARFYVDPTAAATRDPIRLRTKVDGPVDKNDVKFSLVSATRITPDGKWEAQPTGAQLLNDEGDGVLVYPPVETGTYEFKVAGYKKRIQKEGRMMRVFIRDTSYLVQYSERLERVDRDTTTLIASVSKNGIVPPQLTLNVADVQDHWVVGVPYRKKIFVGGVQGLDPVSFSAGSGGRIEKSKTGESFVTLAWDTPRPGKQSFTVNADANRGMGGKDKATVTFSVDVGPAAFALPQPEQGFWGLPYTFDGQLVGLNPLELSVETIHDGKSLGTKGVTPKNVVTPERSWTSMLFKVMYHGGVVKEHKVALGPPPPPQIRWVQQNLDKSRNAFVISAQCADPVGGPVKMSLQAQPDGIATLDKIRGTSFSINVKLASKPSAVFLKLTATDQYGGTSVSSKQFNVPQ